MGPECGPAADGAGASAPGGEFSSESADASSAWMDEIELEQLPGPSGVIGSDISAAELLADSSETDTSSDK